jgi:GT2 family glycosyltransferase
MRKVVLFGMMTNKAVPGIAHLTMPYVVGLERLGYDAYYVETHGSWPTQLQDPEDETSDGSREASAYIERVNRWFRFGGRWAFHARHSDGRCYGMSSAELRSLYANADLFLNLHAGTFPPEELADDDRLVLLDTDPVGLQIDACQELPDALELLNAHSSLFSWGENLGNADCGVPMSHGFDFRPTRVPVLLDLWRSGEPPSGTFTTVGNWLQDYSDRVFEGERYTWSKHEEFLKFIDLPLRTSQPFELALASYDDEAERLLAENGWHLRPALEVSRDLDNYTRYIVGSRAEFTVAKDQNVRLRSGWFSDRSATYLAAGRPVVTQETGFSNSLPTGEGLFAFSTMDEILAAVEAINSDYERHSAAARVIAEEYFDARKVLTRLLSEVGLERRSLSVLPVSRRPTRLQEATVEAALSRPVPPGPAEAPAPEASIVVVAVDGLPFTRLCLESVLEHTEAPPFELLVVDNASSDGTRAYLELLAARDARVRVIRNEENRGFAAAANQGLASARGDLLLLLNNDTIVPPGWLTRLATHLAAESVGAVGPVTNRIGTDAEVDVEYEMYGEFLEAAAEREERSARESRHVRMLAMFCLALRRDVFEEIGPLDERFELGMLEDDDYSERLRRAGYGLVCAEDVLVHHFGEASFGDLFENGERDALLKANVRRFEEKWGSTWQPHEMRRSEQYRGLIARIRAFVSMNVLDDGAMLVVSKGDDELLDFGGRRAVHFPRMDDGTYAGYHPADIDNAIELLELERARGARYLLIPQTAAWWLDHYAGLREYLERESTLVMGDEACSIFRLGAWEWPAPGGICVLGMHRSGTSLVAGLLHLLGVHLGSDDHLMTPTINNPKGYWENQHVTDLNDAILGRLGGSWSDIPTLPPFWPDAPPLADLRQRARELLRKEFAASQLWGFKDPRTCITLPLWQRLAPPLKYVITVRNPLDSARSLSRSESVDCGHGLWLTYMASCLINTAGHPRLFLEYEDAIEDPLGTLAQLATFIGKSESLAEREVIESARRFVDGALRRERSTVDEALAVADLDLATKALYLLLRACARPGADEQLAEGANALSRAALAEIESRREREFALAADGAA